MLKTTNKTVEQWMEEQGITLFDGDWDELPEGEEEIIDVLKEIRDGEQEG